MAFKNTHQPLARMLTAFGTALITATSVAISATTAAAAPNGNGTTGPSAPVSTHQPAPERSAQLFAINTSAVNLGVGRGEALGDLAILNGQLYSSYGDYGANVGPIAVNSHSLTGGAETKHLTVNGEELMALRVFDGALYTADVDPTVSWGANAGFASNASGSWGYNAATPFIHVFDVAKVGENIFLAGSIVNPDPAVYGSAPYLAAIKHSADGGKTWTISKVRSSSTGSNDYDRYYWLAAVNGKVYAHAAVAGNTVMDVWSAGSWKAIDTRSSATATAYDPADVQVFGSKVLAATAWGATVIDGAAKSPRKTLASPTGLLARVTDFAVDGTTAYAITKSVSTDTDTVVTLQRSTDGVSWTTAGDYRVPIAVRYWDHGGGQMLPLQGRITSVAINDGSVYLGGNDGRIYTAPLN